MTKAKSKKKDKPLYDQNGRWIEEHYKIKGALRVLFRQHPSHKESHTRARVELPPKILKDGSTGKVNQIFYRCAICDGLFKQKNVVPDHRDPVVPLYKADIECTPNELVERMFVTADELQIVCATKKKDLPKGQSSCHAKKTREENFIRDRILEHFAKMGGVSNTFSRVQIANEIMPGIKQKYERFLEAERLEFEAKELRKQQKLNKKSKKG